MSDEAATRELTIYTARKIITMEPDLPEATAVGVIDGRIAGVGTLETLQPWMDSHPHRIDEQFKDHVLMPGLIDPHLHPFLPAVLSQMPFVAPDDWRLPTGDFPGIQGRERYVDRVREYFASHDFAKGPFFTWGFHQMFHGDIYRDVLDEEISADQPVFLWHRSFHEIITNSAGLELLNIKSLDDVPAVARAQSDLEKGRFLEAGLGAVLPPLMGQFMAPDAITLGFMNFAGMVHQSGVTTVADLGTGIMLGTAEETAILKQAFERDGVPFRLLLTPIQTGYYQKGIDAETALAEINGLIADGGHRVYMHKHFKLMADGAFYSQTFQMCEPGYCDDHDGEWIIPPEQTAEFAAKFWEAGFQLHVHCNGDGGAQMSLVLLEDLLNQSPRFDHRFTFEHWGYATEDQTRKVAALNAVVSGQPWYVHVLGDKYAEVGMGPDRAHQMCRFGSVVEKGVPLALHSDCPMAPLSPLELAWSAATRETLNGNVLTPNQRLTLDQALRAVTTDAAWILRIEDEVGSIRTGKKADFAVLDSDPYEVGVAGLRDIRIVGTVFEGDAYPL